MKISQLPLRRNPEPIFRLSLVVAALMAITALAGLLFQSEIYLTDDLRYSFVSTDVVNLLIVLPTLLGSVNMTRRGRLIGLLFLPGALLVVIYHYIAYAVAMLFTWQFWGYLALAFLSAYTTYLLLSSVDALPVREQLKGKVPERFAGIVLAGFGILFFVWRGILAVQAITGSAVLSQPEFATAITDVFLAPAWIAGGILLWRKHAFGYVIGTGLFFQFSMLFVGLFVFFTLQPLIAGVPFPLDDFIAVFGMGLICFIPFGLFVRGIILSSK